MSKKFAALGALAGIAVAGGAMGQAHAGVFLPSQSQEFTLATETSDTLMGNSASRTDETNQTLTFDLFDPSEGTLIAVTIEATFEGQSNLTVNEGFAEGGTATGFPSVNRNTLTFSIAGADFMSREFFSSNVFCSAEDIETACNNSNDEGVSGAISQMSFDLNEFVGPGTFDIGASLVSAISQEGGNQLFGSISGDVSVQGDLTVEFEFIPTPVTVPEPTSIAILGLGLAIGGLGMTRRKRAI